MGFAEAQFPWQSRVFYPSPRASTSPSVVSRYHDVFCVTLRELSYILLFTDYRNFCGEGLQPEQTINKRKRRQANQQINKQTKKLSRKQINIYTNEKTNKQTKKTASKYTKQTNRKANVLYLETKTNEVVNT